MKIIAIALGGSFGCLLRYAIGYFLNPLFIYLPLGTLASNLLGGYLIGLMLGVLNAYPLFPEALRLGIITGFLGGLTTFSTFSAETITLLTTKSYYYSILIICTHVLGSLFLTLCGMYTMKFILRGA